jgi:rhodanese-related sulfurtransferase
MPRTHPKTNPASTKTASHRRKKKSQPKLTWLWIILAALIVLVAGTLLLKPKATPSLEITPAQAYAKLQQGAFFLDVRSQEEWDQAHVAGSTLIPLDQLQNRLGELPSDQDIVVVCLTGYRSLNGATILQQAGFKHVSCLSGGLQAWVAAGNPCTINKCNQRFQGGKRKTNYHPLLILSGRGMDA